jgi:hypothetical protein
MHRDCRESPVFQINIKYETLNERRRSLSVVALPACMVLLLGIGTLGTPNGLSCLGECVVGRNLGMKTPSTVMRVVTIEIDESTNSNYKHA